MNCAQCGERLIPGKRFCASCGAPAALRCAACGSSIELGFKYCPDCGAAVGNEEPDAAAARVQRRRAPEASGPAKPSARRQAPAGERKLVTVLFCDLVGSTAIAERLDPEEYHELLERYLELVLREIHRLGGMVNQMAGDGVMALFGAPLAHEDAPERAIRSALAIRDALERLSGESAKTTGPALRVRIGVHTGSALLGPIGNDLKMDYTAIGDTTNIAARLQSLAKPGTILISEATRRLVRGIFTLGQAGDFDLKGKSERVRAFEVRGLSEAATPMEIAAARGLTPLVGRAGELAQLAACFERLEDKLPQVVAIVGEAGSGKSRLLHEFKRHLAGKEVVFFEARCSSLTQNVPFDAIIGMLKEYFGITPQEGGESMCAKLSGKLRELGEPLEGLHPFLCRLLSLPAEGQPDLPPEELKRQMFEAAAKLVIAVSEKTPVVMILEDLQWMDDASRELLDLAVNPVEGARVMIAVSHRPAYQPAWRTEAAFTRLNLRPLPEQDAVAMIRAVAGGSLPPELERLIMARAEGNPFFTEEMTRALFEDGNVARSNGTLRLTRALEEIRVPDTVQELIAARLDRLPPRTKRVAQVGSVLGRQFRRSDVEWLTAEERIDVRAALGELQRLGLIHSNQLMSDEEFRFGESLTQEVAYEGLLLKERRLLHERVGIMLEGDGGQAGAEASALTAHHFARSNNLEKTLESSLRAAEEAEKVPSYRAASTLYLQAWEAAEGLVESATKASDTVRRRALKAALGACRMPVLYSSDDPARAERVACRGEDLAVEIGDVAARVHLRSLHGMLVIMSGKSERFDEGLKLVEEAHASARQAGLALAAIGISRGLAWNYFIDGRFELAGRTIGWAVDELERLGQGRELSDVYLGVLWFRDALSLQSDRLDEALAGATRTHDLARSASNRTVQSSAAGTVALVHFLKARYAEAKEWADRGLEIAQTIGLGAATRTNASIALLARIELGEGGAKAHYARLLDERIGGSGGAALHGWLVVDALLAAGELEQAERAAQAFSGGGGQFRKALAALARANVLLRLGPARWEEAARLYETTVEAANALGARSTLAAGLLGAAELAGLRGEIEKAARLLEQAVKISRELGLQRYLLLAERIAGEALGESRAAAATLT